MFHTPLKGGGHNFKDAHGSGEAVTREKRSSRGCPAVCFSRIIVRSS
jgi:hypothetical protein